MRLYATTTSERATKGQGGNQYINIEIFVFDRFNPRYTIRVTDEQLFFCERGYSSPLLERNHKDIKDLETKGKRQKDEKVPRKCEHYGCGNYAEPDSEYCIAH